MYSPEDFSLAFRVAQYPDPRLNRRALQFFEFESAQLIIRSMRMTALLHGASFITAPQCKLPLRIIFLSKACYSFINPEVLEQSQGLHRVTIRCPSFPSHFVIERPSRSVIQAQDETGSKIVRELEGEDAVCASVAIDYLNGKTLADELNWLARLKLRLRKPLNETKMPC